MATYNVTLRGIPLWLMREYLEEIGGTIRSESVIYGEGWEATLIQLEPHKVGSLRIGQVQLDVAGDADALQQLKITLDKKTMRLGG